MMVTDENVDGLVPDPEQPRKYVDPTQEQATTEDIRTNGVHVPGIGYRDERGLIVMLDGHRRLECSKRAGRKTMPMIVLEERPSTAKLHQIQLALDVHKVSLTPFERADLLKKIMEENRWSVTEVAVGVGMKQPLVSRLLPLADMKGELRELLRGVDQDKCYYVAIADAAKQVELAQLAGGMTRDQVHRKARGMEPKAKSAVLQLAGGYTVTLKGRAFNLKDAMTVFQSAMREIKHAEREGWDISTLIKVLGDRAKAAK